MFNGINVEYINKSIKEAKEFIELCENMKIQYDSKYRCCTKESGSIKRKSMDLTRALAEFRNNPVGSFY